MTTLLHEKDAGTPESSETPNGLSTLVDANDCRKSEQVEQSGHRLRNLILVGNAVAWIVIIILTRVIFF